MTDTVHMRRALELAVLADGSVAPRPPVGAVVVTADGHVAGEGYTQPGSGPHAEVVALERAGERARGSTVYVSLEPCAHHGATPPCAEALVDAGVARVVAAVPDPNPSVDGAGFRRLKQAGITVRTGMLRKRAEAILEPFSTWITEGRPLVTLKLAASLDGKVAAPDGTSRWITGPAAREEVHELRRRVDAVAVGTATVIADDPALTCRRPGFEGPQPKRIVLDSTGRTPPEARIFDGAAPCLILTTALAAPDRRDAWTRAGAEVVVLPRHESGVDLAEALRALGERGLCHLLVEGGPTLAASFVTAGLVDRLRLYVAPSLIGGDAPGLFADGVKTLADAWRLRIERTRWVGEDLRIDARFVSEGA